MMLFMICPSCCLLDALPSTGFCIECSMKNGYTVAGKAVFSDPFHVKQRERQRKYRAKKKAGIQTRPSRVRVVCVDNGVEYESMASASRELDVPYGLIKQSVDTGCKAHGLRFRKVVA